ncbi:MAG: hypothetical protein IKL95_03350 [Alphaproteobacteria bacterium]|nr:hypothetical protein [Alphaproteobacteria bacterium]
MSDNMDARARTLARDAENLAVIDEALNAGRIDAAAADYLKLVYSNGMDWFREVFHVLGKCLGAPKAAVVPYDVASNSGKNVKMKIADINPLESYLVQHRLDMDPMRNQFFTSSEHYQIDLSVSSIVTVIVGAQKDVHRAIDKVTGKYYTRFLNSVLEVVSDTLGQKLDSDSMSNLENKIREQFAAKYITDAAAAMLDIIGNADTNLAVELVRGLDKIKPAHQCLADVWRIKCLFDLIPQARTFIERIQEVMPDRILEIRDKFYDITNPRNYRDAKIILNIGKDGNVVPMEIICQVRKFFEAEIHTHKNYEAIRKSGGNLDKQQESCDYMEQGVRQYNLMIVDCLQDLFERVGWNILYSRDHDISMFDGFPKACNLYYPAKLMEHIRAKLTLAVENEIFHMTYVPAKLTKDQETQIFLFMARFVLVAAMPYSQSDWNVPNDDTASKLFNFVMKEVQRYYKNNMIVE